VNSLSAGEWEKARQFNPMGPWFYMLWRVEWNVKGGRQTKESPPSSNSPPQPSQPRTVQRVYVRPTKCTCQDRGVHGNVYIVYDDGSEAAATQEGNCVAGDYITSERVGPKVAPDEQTVGWLVGEHLNDDGGRFLYATKLMLYKNGRIIRTITPGGFVRGWRFWNDGKQVAVSSGAKAGPGGYELYDIATGRVMAKCEDPLDENAPEWAKGLFY